MIIQSLPWTDCEGRGAMLFCEAYFTTISVNGQT